MTIDTDTGDRNVTVTQHDTMSAAQIAARMSPSDQPDLIKPDFVARRMANGTFPSTKIGHHRVMTEEQYWEALALMRSEKAPHASGLSPRSRRRRAS